MIVHPARQFTTLGHVDVDEHLRVTRKSTLCLHVNLPPAAATREDVSGAIKPTHSNIDTF